MTSVNATVLVMITQVIAVAIVIMVISFVVTVLKRLSEISHSLQSIDEKLGGDKLPEPSSPASKK